MLFDLRPNEEYAGEHLERDPGDAGVQAQPCMSEHEANTTVVQYASTGMVHTQVRAAAPLGPGGVGGGGVAVAGPGHAAV